MTNKWTEQQVHGAIWTLEYVIGLARLTAIEADAVTGLLLPKFVAHSGLDLAQFVFCGRHMAVFNERQAGAVYVGLPSHSDRRNFRGDSL